MKTLASDLAEYLASPTLFDCFRSSRAAGRTRGGSDDGGDRQAHTNLNLETNLLAGATVCGEATENAA